MSDFQVVPPILLGSHGSNFHSWEDIVSKSVRVLELACAKACVCESVRVRKRASAKVRVTESGRLA